MKTKTTTTLILSLMLLTGCEKPCFDVEAEDGETAVQVDGKKFTFTVKGDFGTATFTRAYLQSDGQDMTDLYVFDYVDGACVQTLHQSSGDADFGVPVMRLAYGEHHVYFVASRGYEPTVDQQGHTITWGTPKDTFWKDYQVSVVSTSNGNRAVTLDRVATKMRVVVNDAVPSECASITVTPERWYYGLDYVSGAAVSAQQKERSVSVPSSYAGTTGQLTVSIFGLSSPDEWTTNIGIQARDNNGNVIGSASISGAPFKANRSTEYSGNLFVSGGSMNVSLKNEWETAMTGTW